MKLFKSKEKPKQHYIVNNIETFKVGDEVYPINIRMFDNEPFNVGDKARVRRINIYITEDGCNIEYTLRYKGNTCFCDHKNAFKTKEELLKFISSV